MCSPTTEPPPARRCASGWGMSVGDMENSASGDGSRSAIRGYSGRRPGRIAANPPRVGAPMSPDSCRMELPSWQSAIFGCVSSGQYLCPSIQSAIRFINSVAALLPTVTPA